MLMTCFSMDRLLVCLHPDLLPAMNTEYQCLLCEWRLGESLRERFCSRQWEDTLFYHHSAWVCFDDVYVFTSEMQSCMLWTEVSIWSGLQESCSWVSSAKDWLEMECRRMSVVRSFVYKMNRIGPRTEPCGTPKLSKVGCESLLLMVTVRVPLER